MSNVQELRIPDIGGDAGVDVIEVMVKPGDRINMDDSLITLESEKASMEIPATAEGVVQDVIVKVGDKVSEGDVILKLQGANSEEQDEVETTAQASEEKQSEAKPTAKETAVEPQQVEPSQTTSSTQQVIIPDIGGASGVDVIEIAVKAGDVVEKEDTLITLEGEKATMDIPSPYAGKIEQLNINVGDKVSEGDLILTIQASGEAAPQQETTQATEQSTATAPAAASKPEAPKVSTAPEPTTTNANVYASPAIRRMARELGVNLSQVKASGRKGRIVKQDVNDFVKARLAQGPSTGGLKVPPMPEIDFSQFGEIETKPLNKIKRLTGQNVHRSWVTVPHVTQFDEADITDMDAFRKAQKASAEKQGVKLTPLAFIVKAATYALKQFPQFNSSLDASGENLILKKYCNIGIAVETPNGLVVPVLRDTDKKGVIDLAKEMGDISKKAREKGLMPKDMAGSCFTISSLGGIGGTAFTPIVNTPDVAILGISKAKMQPVYQNGEFVPRLMLPLSLSYDHRVIDGAEAARFTNYLAQCLQDLRMLLL